MAKLRTNHTRSKRPFSGLLIRVVLMIIVLGILFVMLYRLLERTHGEDSVSYDSFSTENTIGGVLDNDVLKTADARSNKSGSLTRTDPLIPQGSQAEVVRHQYYTLGYNEQYEQAEWVSYLLTRDNLKIPNVKRHDRFENDPEVSTGSATYYDYRGSGYSRGHLAPAGDMAQNETAMRESFYMSNMSPQKIPFNGGIWRELEECVRDWTYTNANLYIVSGPILSTVNNYIGSKNRVGVPEEFYKVILDYEGNDKKAIGFIMSNEVSEKPIMDFAVSVDAVERRTGLDFFDGILNDDIEERLESDLNTAYWKVSTKRYNTRINNWNNR